MNDLPELLVIRHGETEWNREGRWQGRLDSPLTERGRAQAERVAELLADLGVTGETHALWVSPQGRARATATPVERVMGTAAEVVDDLSEIDIGDWSGRTRGELLDLGASGDAWWHDQAPGGEGWDGVWTRAGRVLAAMRRPTVMVTHGITSRILRARALGLGVPGALDLPGGQGVVHRVAEGRHETLGAGGLSGQAMPG